MMIKLLLGHTTQTSTGDLVENTCGNFWKYANWMKTRIFDWNGFRYFRPIPLLDAAADNLDAIIICTSFGCCWLTKRRRRVIQGHKGVVDRWKFLLLRTLTIYTVYRLRWPKFLSGDVVSGQHLTTTTSRIPSMSLTLIRNEIGDTHRPKKEKKKWGGKRNFFPDIIIQLPIAYVIRSMRLLSSEFVHIRGWCGFRHICCFSVEQKLGFAFPRECLVIMRLCRSPKASFPRGLNFSPSFLSPSLSLFGRRFWPVLAGFPPRDAGFAYICIVGPLLQRFSKVPDSEVTGFRK